MHCWESVGMTPTSVPKGNVGLDSRLMYIEIITLLRCDKPCDSFVVRIISHICYCYLVSTMSVAAKNILYSLVAVIDLNI